MRKMVSLVSVVLGLAVTLTGCAGCSESETSLVDQLTAFSCRAVIRYDDAEAAADVIRTSDGTTTFTMVEPEALNGLVMEFKTDNVHFSYKGLSFDVEPTSLLASAAGSAIVNSLNDVIRGENLSIQEENGNVVVGSEGESGGYTFNMDENTGAITKLLIPSQGVEVDFSEFKPL